MIRDPTTALEERIDTELAQITENVYTSYPQHVFDTGEGLEWPIVVYGVETYTAETRKNAETRVRCTVDLMYLDQRAQKLQK